MFHLFTAFATLSAATQRKIFIDRSYFVIYPNLYIVIVSPPGKCRKSTAMGYGAGILNKVPGINIESNKISSPQMLVNSLSKSPINLQKPNPGQSNLTLSTTCTAALWSSELSVFLGSDAHQNGMLSLLTDLFDCPDKWTYSSLSRGKDVLHNVYLTLYAATTPEWLTNSIPADAIGGGLTSRIIFVSQKKPRPRNAWPKLTPQLLQLKDDLIHDLIEISTLAGAVSLTSEAEEFYTDWYNAQDYVEQDERFWGYYERKPIHLLKLATLISVAMGNSLTIKVAYLEMALEILARTERRLPEAFIGAGTPVSRTVERILIQIKESPQGVISEKNLYQLNFRHMSQMEITEALQKLEKAGLINQVIVAGQKNFSVTKKLLPGGT
jgi:hypothetical protein